MERLLSDKDTIGAGTSIGPTTVEITKRDQDTTRVQVHRKISMQFNLDEHLIDNNS